MFEVVDVLLFPVEGEHVAVGAANLLECLPSIGFFHLCGLSALIVVARGPLNSGQSGLLLG